MNSRRFFLQQAISAGLLIPLSSFSSVTSSEDVYKLTVLHTNDVHSRIEPFESGKFAGMGGVAKRATIIQKIRSTEKNVLLLDAGDIFQGTPYFNYYMGELEMKLMSELKYDAATIGNHDFDAGVNGLVKQLPHATFPLLNANYVLNGTALEGYVQPYKVFSFEKLKVGVFGIGIELDGLVPAKLYDNIQYSDPLSAAQLTAHTLREKEGCHFIICLSHLGYSYEGSKISDRFVAQNTDGIDLIIGGHTHTFLDSPQVLLNKAGRQVIVNQVGWAGIALGRLDFTFTKGFKRGKVFSDTVKVN